MKTYKISYYRKKADKAMQEWGRRVYDYCEVCGKPMNCLHHFFPKSVSAALRYEKGNLIPLDAGCHLRHHNGDPRIHARIMMTRGNDWFVELEKKKNNIVKPSKRYYLEVKERYDND